MALVYDFSGRESEDKKTILSKLKDLIGSNSTLYMQWLSVLVKEETEGKNPSDSKFL